MNFSEVLRIGHEALQMVLMLSAPVLIAAVSTGTMVSLVQAVTQVHEQTLAFLPKLLAVAAVFAVAGGWMLEQTVGYTTRSFDRIVTVSQ
jgi:flagellar biosynthesis protein FliQ